MNKRSWVACCCSVALASPLLAQDVYPDNTGYGDTYLGPASVGSNEPLFRYDDQERWKHGYIQSMPYYGGYHAFLPYNYHNVFGQSQTAAGWGMSPVLPYSQQFWHRYENMTDLSRGHHTPLIPYVPPVQEWDHFPKPYTPSSALPPAPLQSPAGAPLNTPHDPTGNYRSLPVQPTGGAMAVAPGASQTGYAPMPLPAPQGMGNPQFGPMSPTYGPAFSPR